MRGTGMLVVAGALMALTTQLMGCDAGDTVGPEGGVVTSRDGRVTLEIPQGALSQPVQITIEQVDDHVSGALAATYEIEPRLTQLTRPATLTYDLEAPSDDGAAIDSLSASVMEDVVLVSERDTGWQALADADVDVDAGTVSGSVMYFSSIALVMSE